MEILKCARRQWWRRGLLFKNKCLHNILNWTNELERNLMIFSNNNTLINNTSSASSSSSSFLDDENRLCILITVCHNNYEFWISHYVIIINAIALSFCESISLNSDDGDADGVAEMVVMLLIIEWSEWWMVVWNFIREYGCTWISFDRNCNDGEQECKLLFAQIVYNWNSCNSIEMKKYYCMTWHQEMHCRGFIDYCRQYAQIGRVNDEEDKT